MNIKIEDLRYAGYPGLVTRSPIFGNLCGYVGVSADHPWHGLYTADLRAVKVHGGITYTGEYPLDPDPAGPEAHLWWVGFDCGHAEDFANPKGIGFVRTQILNLAQQAHKAAKK